jgi:hypothetical protein
MAIPFSWLNGDLAVRKRHSCRILGLIPACCSTPEPHQELIEISTAQDGMALEGGE